MNTFSSKFTLNDKIAIVTGAGRGLGRAIAIGYANMGADLVVVDRLMEEMESLVQEIKTMGCRALSIKVDVTEINDVNKMVEQVVNEFGQIDILVNNAGINIKKPAEELSLEEWTQIINVNLTGVFACAQAVGKQMIKQQSGNIINMASMAGKIGLINSAAYCASKGGVIQLTKVLAIEWAKYNIRVNAIGPAYIRTSLSDEAIRIRKGLLESINQRTPLGRRGEPEEVVGAAIYLASDASSYVTGETLFVDGGFLSYGV